MNTPSSLLMRLRRPDEQAAWKEFVRLYTPLLFYWTRRLGLRGQNADDLVQEVFLILVRKLPGFTYDRSKSFRAWLRTIVLNKWRARLRRQTLPEAAGARVEELADPEAGNGLDEAEYRSYLVGRALRLMQDNFEPTTWKACWEYVVRGRPAPEVAAELGVNVAVIYSAKSRVLRCLRQELEGLLD